VERRVRDAAKGEGGERKKGIGGMKRRREGVI
jgi:hypothetical protein